MIRNEKLERLIQFLLKEGFSYDESSTKGNEREDVFTHESGVYMDIITDIKQ